MTIFFRKYFWLLNLLTIGLCALFAAQAIGRLVEVNLPVAQRGRAVTRSTRMGQAIVTSNRKDISGILSRNIFCSTCEHIAAVDNPGGANDGSNDGQPGDQPVKTSLNINLIATLVSKEDKAWSFAAIADLTEGKTRLYPIGAQLAPKAVITDILERRVLIINGSRNEYLDLDSGQEIAQKGEPVRSSPISVSKPRIMSGMEEISNGIRKVGEGKYEIDRSALNKVLGNTTLIARSARIVPSVRNGKPNGFKLYAIRPGSLYSMLGMLNGDTINAINGHPITTPDKALEVYTKLRSASHVTISFSRRGETKTHEYNIR